jgi:hypothetical protein
MDATRRATRDALDEEIISEVIEELERGGPLDDPRNLNLKHEPASVWKFGSVDAFARVEIKRVIDRLRSPLSVTLPKVLSHADIRQSQEHLRQALELLAGLPIVATIRDAYEQSLKLWRSPPERCTKAKYACADEAYYLIEMFHRDRPDGRRVATLADKGMFLRIAVHLYEALSDDSEADMRDVCRYVLEDRGVLKGR